MTRFLSTILLLLLTISCNQQKKDDTVVVEKATTADKSDSNVSYYYFKGDSLLKYEHFLHQLDESDVTNITVAADQFISLFKGQDKQTCDSAYYLFDKFYSEVDDKINELHSNDTTNYDSLVLSFDQGQNIKLSKKLKDYNDKLEQNGFYIAMTEGFTYIRKDRDFVKKNFYNLLSPLVIKYLDQLNKENKEGYWEDGGLIIEPMILIDRIIWWEVFNKENPDFLFKILPSELQRIYTETLITGEDNTPLYYDEGGPLDTYYKTAYEYLLNKYPKTETAKRLRPYYSHLVKLDTAEINKFQKANLKRD